MGVFKNLSRRVRQPFHEHYAFRRLQEYHAAPRSLAEVVDWAMHFGGGGWMRVKTLQIPSEITRLAEAVTAIEPRIILEIGTASGGTALIWAAIASERVISCDLIDMSRQRPLFSRFPPPGSSCRVTLLSGDSHDPVFRGRVASELAGRQVDFLFIDGDHTEAGVTADYEDYRGLVRPGGLIAFHDILEDQPLPTNQVYHLWKRLKHRAPTEEFVTEGNHSGFGIGLLHVPDHGAPSVVGM